MTMSMIR